MIISNCFYQNLKKFTWKMLNMWHGLYLFCLVTCQVKHVKYFFFLREMIVWIQQMLRLATRFKYYNNFFSSDFSGSPYYDMSIIFFFTLSFICEPLHTIKPRFIITLHHLLLLHNHDTHNMFSHDLSVQIFKQYCKHISMFWKLPEPLKTETC